MDYQQGVVIAPGQAPPGIVYVPVAAANGAVLVDQYGNPVPVAVAQQGLRPVEPVIYEKPPRDMQDGCAHILVILCQFCSIALICAALGLNWLQGGPVIAASGTAYYADATLWGLRTCLSSGGGCSDTLSWSDVTYYLSANVTAQADVSSIVNLGTTIDVSRNAAAWLCIGGIWCICMLIVTLACSGWDFKSGHISNSLLTLIFTCVGWAFYVGYYPKMVNYNKGPWILSDGFRCAVASTGTSLLAMFLSFCI